MSAGDATAQMPHSQMPPYEQREQAGGLEHRR